MKKSINLKAMNSKHSEVWIYVFAGAEVLISYVGYEFSMFQI